ncbi:MAG TPA: sn-glycerol-3-phosphate ABC transporter ATP-binding protein UgpC [Solirubrobacteraceae bacterium]|nr:sn-glycerol-3-phosphate ABC transporter ATP-binding protein UgpC [Solirubrobacteraceae bacterium]
MGGIVLESVRKEFAGGVVAVNDINLEVEEGEFVALVGPSGCGKTTTLRMVAGLEDITAGTVSINDRVVTNTPPRHRDIAMVFQNYALYAHMTVRRNIGFGLKMAGVPKDEINRRVEYAANVLGIVPLLDRKPKQLSGGERQRVAMGRAMVREPAAFLMDEPLSNLDAKLRVEMRAEIVNLQRRLATPTLYVTHDQVEAMTMGDRVAILRDGELQQVGTPEELYERPVNVFVATFIGSPAMNLLPGRMESDGGRSFLSVGNSRFPLSEAVLTKRQRLGEYDGREVLVGMRPEDFRAPDHGGADGTAVFRVNVVRAESLGSEVIAYFEPAGSNGTVAAASALSEQAAAQADSMQRLFTARLGRKANVRHDGPADLAVDHERLYFFDPESGEAIGEQS